MQKARIRTGWKNKQRQVSVSEFANATSAICWRMALNAAKNLHEQDFVYDNDDQRLGVIREYLYFFIHCADRLSYASLSQEAREEFINTLSVDCRRHYIQNAREITGRQVDAENYTEELNQTAGGLAGLSFPDEGPGYDMYRMLGSRILDIMGESQTNKWVIDQVMDIDGPNAFDIFSKSFLKLKRSSGL
ncbi:MAG: hypothetical protein KTR32_21440 [Granulosicoccus sp.]|nr:hypothetical protein [Granulosicoccus sp.]